MNTVREYLGGYKVETYRIESYCSTAIAELVAVVSVEN